MATRQFKLTDTTQVIVLLDGAALASTVLDGEKGCAVCFPGRGKVKFKEQMWTDWEW